MPSYDAFGYDPPAPVAQIRLRSQSGGELSIDVAMLIDSGSDITVVPRSVAERLGAKPDPGSAYELAWYDGSKRVAEAVALELVFLNKIFRGKFVLVEGDQGVLGRNVLARVALLLDGPRQEWTEQSA